MRSAARLSICCTLLALTVACSTLTPRNPVPEDLVAEAVVPGIPPEARYLGDEPPLYTLQLLEASDEDLQAAFAGIMGREHNYLAISGGGSRGAFGAGILSGWSEAGTRPEFTIVTGISTGALMAPFAFLGSDYDYVLRDVYTAYATEDLIERRGLLKMLRLDAAADSAPLRELIARYVDQPLVDALAAEFEKGRRLLIGTTNIDTLRPVTWNVTRIAASDAANRLQIIRDVLLASAAIPGALTPVIFEVEAEGVRYDEMHVDGGATAQIFLYPLGLEWLEVLERLQVPGEPHVYTIRNAKLTPSYESTTRRTTAIASRAVTSLIRTQGFGDMYRLYLATERDGLDYHLAFIPDDFNEESTEMFDPVYMGKLFELGYEMAKDGYSWETVPPGMLP